MIAKTRSIIAGCLTLLMATGAAQAASITREVWQNIGGTAVNDLRSSPNYPNSPDAVTSVTGFFEAPPEFGDNYGQRMHGYIVPPQSGEYTFWIASDDGGELWLSTDESPNKAKLIASVGSWTGSREWTKEATQVSAPVSLSGGSAYYISALQKEGGGGDNLAVKWLRPDNVEEGPIPVAYLFPWGTAFASPVVITHPSPANATEGGVGRFTVGIDPTRPGTIQWQKDGVNLSGTTAKSATLEYSPVLMSDHGSVFRAVVFNTKGTNISNGAALTVQPDTTPPTVIGALNAGPGAIRLVFSEPVSALTGAVPANYTVNHGITVNTAVVSADGLSVTLNTSALTIGTTYIVDIRSVTDRAVAPNSIPLNSSASFLALEYIPHNVGRNVSGDTIGQNGSFEVQARGSDIGRKGDDFHFGYQERTGDFDMRVRVESLDIIDSVTMAGLMVRTTLNTNSTFAGIFTGSAEAGAFFESRGTVSADAAVTWIPGGFPANFPNTWLRLKRAGITVTGFGSFDGKGWQQLGTATISGLPEKVFFGMAVTSQDTNRTAVAQFRDLGNVVSPTAFVYQRKDEPLGPSNRRTGLTFSEIMYNPPFREDGKDLEFIEIYSAETVYTDMTGWKITGGVEYDFPAGFIMPTGGFVVLAADPAAVKSVYGIKNVLGPYKGRLNNAGDLIQLRNKAGALRVEVEYGNDAPWPVAADGGGASMILSRPSYGEDDPRAWSHSQNRGGSPGNVEPAVASPFAGLVINEILAHTDAPAVDFIEVHNSTTRTVDLSGYILTDDPKTNKFVIPSGVTLLKGKQIAFDQNRLGFSLDSTGETIFLISPDGLSIIDAIKFGAQANGVSSGRYQDGDPTFRRLGSATPDAANSAWKVEDVVINEIMYQPITREESEQYVELYNRSPQSVDLSGWRFTAGIDYIFPQGSSIAAGSYIVVAKNKDRLLSMYSQLNNANTFGNFDGTLRGSGERIALGKPDLNTVTNEFNQVISTLAYQDVSEVTYADGGRWHDLADGGGSSLELIDAHSDILRPSNWAASVESSKSEWASFEYTTRLEYGQSDASRFLISMLGAGECLIDDIELFRAGSTNLIRNPGFELGTTGTTNWVFNGNHSTSFADTQNPASGARSLHVRAGGDGDTANNAIRAPLITTLAAGQTVTIRAKAKWLSGWPEVLLRVKGNWIEFPIRMNIPRNLGSPGLANSRAVSNAGPAIYDVTHTPILPKVNENVVVTCRLSDPDGRLATLRYRSDPTATLTSVVMKDDGTGGDLLAGDGLYSAIIPGRSAGSLAAFRIEASDDASPSAKTTFPADAPAKECHVRWGDANPGGTFMHYHLWSTAASESARNSANGLNNTFRDCTLVYGDFRVIYNVSYRDKGSPYHGGRGDFALSAPSDNKLLGVTDRIFASTGNGGREETGLRTDVSGWVGERLGISFLHSHYMRLYFNGQQYQNIMYDMEQPNRYYARSWWGGESDNDDLYKISIWFEFQDNNSNFDGRGATLVPAMSNGQLKPSAYRWNWQPRPGGTNASDFSGLYNVINAANQTDKITQLMNAADMDNFMRAIVYNRLLGNWDAYPTGGQNMYMYAPEGGRARLLPWDIDFVFESIRTSDALWGSGDPVMGTLIEVPAYKRMLWRAYQEVVDDIFSATNINPQIEIRRKLLVKNGVAELTAPDAVFAFARDRRNFVLSQLRAADTGKFAVTSNSGGDFTSASPSVLITGTAPFAVAAIEVNGVPFPVTWTNLNSWRITVPLGAPTNVLNIAGIDSKGNIVTNGTKTVTAKYTGTAPQPQDWIVINEIMYHPPADDAEYVELHNRHTTVPFDLTGWKFSGLNHDFPPGTFIQPNSYLVVAANRAAFATAYGASIAVAGEYGGRLDNNGETLRLSKPGASGAADIIIDEVTYERSAPWPASADGLGSSLQLIDPVQDNWRAGNWASLSSPDAARATPGKVNATKAFLPEFPSIWINEILSQNAAGEKDQTGQFEPWVELYNNGGTILDLSQYYLSDDLGVLVKWQFPAGATLAPSAFLRIWLDGQPEQSDAGGLHSNFRIDRANGVVALSRMQNGSPAVIDYLPYASATPDRSFGSYPDGDARKRRLFYVPTPGAANNSTVPNVPIFINEWMASNRSQLLDTVSGRFEDWIEIHNAGSAPMDIGGYYLSDSSTNLTQFRIPAGTVVPSEGYILVWAAGDSSLNAPGREVHTNFRLSADGEEIVLSAQDGTIISSVSFSKQSDNVSQGRYPDGAEAPYFFFTKATPREANVGQFANQFPVISPISDINVPELSDISFKVNGADPDLPAQAITFSLVNPPAGARLDSATGQFNWIADESIGPAIVNITVKLTDSGNPPLSATKTFRINVSEVNQAPFLPPIAEITAEEGMPISMAITALDSDLPPQGLTFSLIGQVPAGASIGATDGVFQWTPSESHGPGTFTFRVRVADSGPGNLTFEREFIINVLEINNSPLITPVGPQSVDEGALFEIAIQAADPDSPQETLLYELLNAPPGASIHPQTGVIRWTPAEEQGPFTYELSLKVSEPGGLRWAGYSFAIGVREVNTAPVMEAIQDFHLTAGQSINYTVQVTDVDRPSQALTFTAQGLPEGAVLEPNTGTIRFSPGSDPLAGIYNVTLRVSDTAAPSLTAERTFKITVSADIKAAINEIMFRPLTAGAEFVELANGSAANPLDLSGWKLEGFGYTFPAGTILPAGGYLCVAKNLAAFRTAYGLAPLAVGAAAITLPAEGGLVQLIKPGIGEQLDQVMDAVFFEMRAPWPVAAISQGASLQLINPLNDHRRVANWGASSATVTNPAVTVVPLTGNWRFYQAAAFPGAAWNTNGFNDASWSSGGALFFVEEAAVTAPKTTPLALGRITYYFRTTFEYSGNITGAKLRIAPFLDDGAVFYLNGREVYRIGMAEGTVGHETVASRTVGDAAQEPAADVPAFNLKDGTNILAVEVHQVSTGSSDIVFGAKIDLVTLKPASFTPGARNSIMGGDPSAFPPIWINEVAPQNTTGIKDQSGAAEPWIELVNTGEAAISLGGWALSDQYSSLNKWIFPAGATIPGKGYLLIFADGEAQQTTSSELHANFRLAPQTGSVALSRPETGGLQLVDYLNYSGMAGDQSFGRALDGDPFLSKIFTAPSPARANGAVMPVAPSLMFGLTAENKLQLSWNGVAGIQYKLQSTPSLENPNWETIQQGPGGAGQDSKVETIEGSHKFYRLTAE